MGMPLLFLDVDGPLIPYGGTQPVSRRGVRHEREDDDTHPGLRLLNPGHGPRLAALECTLVWATAWENDANVKIAPRLGLPELPVVYWPDSSDDDLHAERRGLHWKTRRLVEWADGRPFVWVDDELTETDREWVAALHPAPALLHLVDHRTGLTDEDFRAVERWLAAAG